jgi:predicted permease
MADRRPPGPFRLEVGGKRVEREVDAEIEFHLAMRARKLAASGLDPAVARERALELFGDLDSVRRECLSINHERERSMTRKDHLGALRQDIGYAFRSFRSNKGFTLVLLLILALGIGANTAVFSLIDALIRRPLPVPHPEQLVIVGDPRRSNGMSTGSPQVDLFSYPLYADLRDGNRVTTGLLASGHTGRLDAIIAEGETAEHPVGRLVSGNYFDVLQVPVAAGRTFSQAEDQAPGRDPVVVISHEYWQRRFGGDRSVVGRSIIVNRIPLTIIGVAREGWTGDVVGQRTDLWIPLMMEELLIPHRPWLTDRGASWLLLMGRLAPGITLERARLELSDLLRSSLTRNPTATGLGDIERELRNNPIRVEAGARGFSYYRSAYAQSLVTLMAAVGLVLLVVSANVAHLMLARAAARGREMSVRMALGAGRARLVQQLLTESVLLTVMGGALGLLVALWGSAALLRLAGGGSAPIPLEIRLDAGVLGFAAAVSLLTAILVGLVPALRATRVELATSLRTAGRGTTGGSGRPGRSALGKTLVVAQVALSLLLLVSTGMLLRSMQRLDTADVGLARDSLLMARIDAGRSGYAGPRLFQLLRDVTARLERLPGVAAVSWSENGIFSGTESATTLQVEGFRAATDEDTVAAYDRVGPGYFTTLGARLLQGRDFTPNDHETAPKAAVVNQTMAAFYFKTGSPLGRYVTADSATWTIVGVVADVQGQDVRGVPERRLYLAAPQSLDPPTSLVFAIRTTGDPARLVDPVRRAIGEADPTLTSQSIYPLSRLIGESIGPTRMVAKVIALFGGLTLLLAALGLYGVMAYAAVRRTGEFGLRMALGAAPARVARMVLREALVLVAAGIVLGLPFAFAAGRVLRNQIFGIDLVDPPSIVLAVAVLGSAAVLAGFLPARRAGRVAPLEAIRAD